MKQISNSLKDYAKQAKKRLASGYWENIRQDRAKFLEEHFSSGSNISQLKHMYQKKVERDLFSDSQPSSEDEKLYKKVSQLLSENEYVLNPITQLIDHSEYDKLDEREKQSYIFKLTDKYNELKEKFENEHRSCFA